MSDSAQAAAAPEGEAAVASSSSWRLSHVLAEHTSDVKALHACTLEPGIIDDVESPVEALFSASRDGTARSWVRELSHANDGEQRRGPWRSHGAWADPQGRFLNAVHYVGGQRPQLLTAGLSGQVLSFPFPRRAQSGPPVSKGDRLAGHDANVTALHSAVDGARHILVSSSWDGSARTWTRADDDEVWTPLDTMWHDCAVWDARVCGVHDGEPRVLTSGADRFVRLFHGSQLVRVWAGHGDVVRALVPLSEPSVLDAADPAFYAAEPLFLTTSNDGSARVWSLDERRCPPGVPTSGGEALRVLPTPGEPFVYAGAAQGSLAATAGEEGAVRLWNWESAALQETIAQPSISIWAVALLPCGDVVAASNTGRICIYTAGPAEAHEVDEAERAAHEEACAEVAQRTRRGAGPTAEVIAASGDAAPPDEGQLLDGVRYDAVLSIDVSDDAPPLQLGLNAADDAHDAAVAFVAKHALPESYVAQIEEFIKLVAPRTAR